MTITQELEAFAAAGRIAADSKEIALDAAGLMRDRAADREDRRHAAAHARINSIHATRVAAAKAAYEAAELSAYAALSDEARAALHQRV